MAKDFYKRVISDETYKGVMASAETIRRRIARGLQPLARMSAERLRELDKHYQTLDRQDPLEVLIFELKDPEVRADRMKQIVPGRSNLPLGTQLQKITGTHYFDERNFVHNHIKAEWGRRELARLCEEEKLAAGEIVIGAFLER